jgi:hypothetical protein
VYEVVVAGDRVIVVSTPLPSAEHPRVCVGALGWAPRDCFETALYRRLLDGPFERPVAAQAEGGEVVVGWLEPMPGGRRLRLRSYRCEWPAPPWEAPAGGG